MGATPEVFVTSNQSELSLNGTLHMYESNREKFRDEDPVLAKNQIRGSVPQSKRNF